MNDSKKEYLTNHELRKQLEEKRIAEEEEIAKEKRLANEIEINTSIGSSKKCPFCAEEILKEAIKCRYCKSSLENTSSPDLDKKSTEETSLSKINKNEQIIKKLLDQNVQQDNQQNIKEKAFSSYGKNSNYTDKKSSQGEKKWTTTNYIMATAAVIAVIYLIFQIMSPSPKKVIQKSSNEIKIEKQTEDIEDTEDTYDDDKYAICYGQMTKAHKKRGFHQSNRSQSISVKETVCKSFAKGDINSYEGKE